ncbi:hypothetical protein, partial [uncultured Chryseobacterium sp.]|uniref:hypothetical protein n=1 Tax=uncultured Chryseobacterium sp. TaxID=259322 RepID=UPI0025CE666D
DIGKRKVAKDFACFVGIRRKDFIRDKMEGCLSSRTTDACKAVYSAALKFGFAEFLAPYTAAFPCIPCDFALSNTHQKSGLYFFLCDSRV